MLDAAPGDLKFPLNHIDPIAAKMLEPRASNAKHRRALVECDDVLRVFGEQLGHPASAGADVEHPAERF